MSIDLEQVLVQGTNLELPRVRHRVAKIRIRTLNIILKSLEEQTIVELVHKIKLI